MGDELHIQDAFWMTRCLALAKLAKWSAFPNPMVGAVLVRGMELLGEGYHKQPGEPHAEPMAWKQAGNPPSLQGLTLYVNLEPCSHHGRTSPCSDLLRELKPDRVVIAHADPDPRVAGKGIQALRGAGIKVEVGCLAKQAIYLNRHYLQHRLTGRPFVTLKWAQTKDGFMGYIERKKGRLNISGIEAQQFVHRMRSAHASILVGAGTVLQDRPALSVREIHGRSPMPVVLWANSPDADQGLAYKHQRQAQDWGNWDFSERNSSVIADKLSQLPGNSVLVEGGKRVLTQLLESGLWDELVILQSQTVVGGDLKAPLPQPMAVFEGAVEIGKSDLALQYLNPTSEWNTCC